MQKSPLIMTGVACLLLLTSHWPSLTLLVETWDSWPEYEYGAMVPLISGWLVWQRRGTIRVDGAWLGVVIVLVGAMTSFAGRLAMAPAIVQYGFVILILGLALSLTGWNSFKQIAAPLMVLFFMVPLPTSLHISLSSDLQWLSAELGASFLHAAGVPVFLDGNIIDLGEHKLDVVEACSGLRYLLPLTTFSFVCGFMYRGPLWMRSLVVLSGIPLAILLNGFRLGVTGIMTNTWGISMAQGFMHDFQGWWVYGVGLAVLMLEMVFFNRLQGHGKALAESLQFELVHRISTGEKSYTIPKPFLVAMIPLCLLALTATVGETSATRMPRRPFSELPMALEGWRGVPNIPLSKQALQVLGLDDYLMADFSDGTGRPPINLYAAYYWQQKIGKAIHTPRTCLPGNGWTMSDLQQIQFSSDAYGSLLPVNRAVMTKDGHTQLIYYWFQQAGRSIADPLEAKWYMLKDSVSRGRGDSALVRLIIPLAGGGAMASADNRLQQFARTIIPHLKNHIPD